MVDSSIRQSFKGSEVLKKFPSAAVKEVVPGVLKEAPIKAAFTTIKSPWGAFENFQSQGRHHVSLPRNNSGPFNGLSSYRRNQLGPIDQSKALLGL